MNIQMNLANNLQEYNQLIQSKVNDLINNKAKQQTNFESLLNILEDLEQNINVKQDESSNDFILLQLLCYIFQNDTVNGRYFWKRQSVQVKSQQILQQTYQIVKNAWFNEYLHYRNSIKMAQKLISLQDNLFIHQLFEIIYNNSQDQILQFLLNNYINISLHEFSQMLQLNEQDSRNLVYDIDWKIDNDFVIINQSKRTVDNMSKITESQIDQITQIMAFIEKHN